MLSGRGRNNLVSYTFDVAYDLLGNALLNYAGSTSIYLGLALDGTALAGSGQPSASDLAAITNLNECNYSGYSRHKISGLALVLDTTAHLDRWTFSPVTFTGLGSSVAAQVVGAFIYTGSSSTGKPLHWFDTSPLFPFSGGGDKVITAPPLGAVRISG